MAKKNKLSKLKCILKRWNSSPARTSSSSSSSAATTTGSDDHEPAASDTWRHSSSFGGGADGVPAGYRPVYVGKSRRRYVVSERLLGRPVFRNLLESSSSPAAVVGCEVVLFEHLLWMLDNADHEPDSLDELVELYAC